MHFILQNSYHTCDIIDQNLIPTCTTTLTARTMQRVARMKRELVMLEKDPPPRVTCWAENDKIDHLQARKIGLDIFIFKCLTFLHCTSSIGAGVTSDP